ncbi:hypothetical protein HY570_02990 [Candidatus Micrarchaeota archaeon]|nr:hypothetical protein [Candidatus Micrarchaeota archaeon]
MVDEKLKKELEKVYEESVAQFNRDLEKLKKAIPAIRKKDYSTLVSIFKTLENKSFVLPDREQLEKIPQKELEESIELLSSDAARPPEIKNSKFIAVKSEGPSAAYYMQTDLDIPDCITITVVRFHKVGTGWKRDDMIYSSSFAKGATEKENQEAIVKEMETNPGLKL